LVPTTQVFVHAARSHLPPLDEPEELPDEEPDDPLDPPPEQSPPPVHDEPVSVQSWHDTPPLPHAVSTSPPVQ
jgi:hypothetical protein